MKSYLPVIIFGVFLAITVLGFLYFHFKETQEEEQSEMNTAGEEIGSDQ
jgi:predicted tellurium resistance membrane protein TerC